jgi:succinate dehydrogenase/fumarate reductase flavoprotein subunit
MSSKSCDVIVVGGGGSGLMAALTASRFGRSVLLLEKQRQLGGTTRLSVGTICVTSTPHQRAMGITDTPNEHFEDMPKFPGFMPSRDNPILRRLLVNETPETFQVLQDIGVVFVGPIPEPPHRVPRLHAIVPHSKGYIDRLAAACRRHDVEIVRSVTVTRLLTEGARVSGVEYVLASGQKETAQATSAVILASGDFSSADSDYKQRFMTGPLLKISGINPGSTGDGHRLGETVGGEIINGDLAWGPEIRYLAPSKPSLISRLPCSPWLARLIAKVMPMMPPVLMRPFLMGFLTTYLAPSHGLFSHGAVLVNKRGERFCNELDRPQDHIGDQPDQIAYILFDSALAEKLTGWPNYISTAPGVGYAYLSDYEKCRKDIFFRANSLEALAQGLSIDAAALSASISAYNASLQSTDRSRAPILKPPFYALGPAKSWIVFSEGGLRVNERLQVLRSDGSPIPGLFAAGSAGQGGVLLEGHGHHLGWAFTSGRLAGRNAALHLGIVSGHERSAKHAPTSGRAAK